MEVYVIYACGGMRGILMMEVYGVVYVYVGVCGISMCRDHHMRY